MSDQRETVAEPQMATGKPLSRLRKLERSRQSVWLDFIDRSFLNKGGLQTLIEEDGLGGVTSNPTIFEKAIGHSDAYDDQLEHELKDLSLSIEAAYERLAIADIQTVADALQPSYSWLGGKDGYVSMEVSPYLAHDMDATIAAAHRLRTAIDRPNLMIKVPATDAGIPAIRQLIADGLSINVTLLFSVETYKAVLEAYISGLETRAAHGHPIGQIASVASFFVSRIDSMVDAAIEKRVAAADPDANALKALGGKVAIANAKIAYQHYLDVMGSQRWRILADKGAMPQRLLWASTGTKNPAYSDILYVDGLIGPDTVNTMPPKTMDAFRDHGVVRPSLTADLDDAKHVLSEAKRLGLNLDAITSSLVETGVRQFAEAADALYAAVAEKRSRFLGTRLNGMQYALPEPMAQAVRDKLDEARREGWPRRLWAHDSSLWTHGSESAWLGWLAAARGTQVDATRLAALGREALRVNDVVLLGMGGSSLGPEVIAAILGSVSGSPTLHVLDSTDPTQIARIEKAIDPAGSLFIVSSKSGSTMEPELLRAYFFDLVERAVGKEAAGERFIAVTDPGSQLEASAKEAGFAHIFHGEKTIGGRYSVLSAFGMVPAAAIGLDVARFFSTVEPMVHSVGPDAPPAANPGFELGAILGIAANGGRDKLTLLSSSRLRAFGSWLEQLIAESTGKQGKGLVPVDLEDLGAPCVYGQDRLFVHLHLDGDDDQGTHDYLTALQAAGHPVVRITVHSPEQIGQEFVRWEVATAVAGAVIGINPFDQPDVEDAKVQTRDLIARYEDSGALDAEQPFFEDAFFTFHAPVPLPGEDAVAILRHHLGQAIPGNYVGFLVYCERSASNEALVASMRLAVRDAYSVATVGGFGPRFLHSTGQAYKGGPKSGIFLEMTREPTADLAVPGRRATFGTVQIAQARGDLEVLAARGQKTLRVHLKDEQNGLAALERAVVLAVAPPAGE